MAKPLFRGVIRKHFNSRAKVILYPGDANDFLCTLPDDSVHLIVTSPPYNIGKPYESRVTINNYLDVQSRIISELCRVLRKDGSICWQVGTYVKDGEIYPLDIPYYHIFKRFKLVLRNRIIWYYEHGLHASKRFSGRYECILWFTKSDEFTFNLDAVRVPSKYPGKRHYKGSKKGKLSGNPKGKNPSDVWKIVKHDWENIIWNIPNVKANHPEKTPQPCQFPVELVERCVLALSREGNWVLDPYAGVGSTLIAALLHKRRAMGSEKDPKYYKLAIKRLEDLRDGTIRLRPLGTPVYQPTGNEKVAQVPEIWKRRSRAY